MYYHINRENYKQFDVFQVNKEPSRAYFIPFSDILTLRDNAVQTHRQKSDKVKLLSGADWQFKYYKKVSQMPEVFDTETEKMQPITVPSTWQRTGYEPPFYVNQDYQFPANPPHIPEDIPVGVYKKTFIIESLDKQYILSLLGVAPSADVYVNGQFVGYSEGSHNTAEYTITPFLQVGENELLLVVHKWCNGTYLEAQDMFRENGIFRDVLLFMLDKTYIHDFKLTSVKKIKGYDANLDIMLRGDIADYQVTAFFEKDGQEIIKQSKQAENKVAFFFENIPFEDWNAEKPNLYDLYVTLEKNGKVVECFRHKAGFKYIEIKGEVFYFNGRAIKIRGVNHHDTHEKNGYVLSIEEMEKDIRLMKSLNVNTVRTAHYPPDPFFLTLCDMYGLYVIDEADIETHGMESAGKGRNAISNDLRWQAHYIDRVNTMYMRDRNHVSITLWSLGNEAGGYKCQDACYALLKENCPQIPVHYEGVRHTKRKAYDVYSSMYDSIALLEKRKKRRGNEPSKGKPFLLCEYAHAMGVGPGSLEDYMQIFYSDDKFMGGCIWEWADHAVLHEDGDGPCRYTYGGDHGEFIHDSNFCVDGLLYPDRTLHTGALAMKAVYRPIRCKKVEDGYQFTNTNAFRDSNDIKICYELLENGVIMHKGDMTLNIAPGASMTTQIDLPKFAKKRDYHINFIYEDADGFEIAREQIPLVTGKFFVEVPEAKESELSFDITDKAVEVYFNQGYAYFDKDTGALISYYMNGQEYLNVNPAGEQRGLLPNIYRAPLDNDMYIKKQWHKRGLDQTKIVGKKLIIQQRKQCLRVNVKQTIRAKKTFASVRTVYDIYANGVLKVQMRLKPRRFFNEIARFGFTVELAPSLQNIKYYGRGDAENLPDFKEQAYVGLYETTVKAMHEPYIKPQDNGNRTDVHMVKFYDNEANGIMFYHRKKPFTFSAHEYTQKTLQKAMHQEDIVDEGTIFVSVDGYTRGTGSNSCGPRPLDEYIVRAKKQLNFHFYIMPVADEEK